MINKEIEEKFVKTFVDKRIQERMLFELNNVKKVNKKNYELRSYAIQRFASGTSECIKRQYIFLTDHKPTIDDIEKELKKLCVSTKNCYIMGTGEEKIAPLRQALEESFDWLGTSIIIINENTAFIKTEQAFGPPLKYILHKKRS